MALMKHKPVEKSSIGYLNFLHDLHQKKESRGHTAESDMQYDLGAAPSHVLAKLLVLTT